MLQLDECDLNSDEESANSSALVFLLKSDVLPIIAGYGGCKSCECRGFIGRASAGNTCKCGHHISQHK